MPVFANLATEAAAVGVKLVVDHGRVPASATTSDRDTITALVSRAHLYLPSRLEFLDLWHVETIEAGLRRLNADYPELVVIVKDGAHGAHMLEAGRVLTVPAFKVVVQNPVGAGDSFNAGVIVARHQGLDWPATLRFAQAVAALKISRTQLPSLAQVQTLMEKPL
jgi:sugar/nucleoside kinase (ribokinase family)